MSTTIDSVVLSVAAAFGAFTSVWWDDKFMAMIGVSIIVLVSVLAGLKVRDVRREVHAKALLVRSQERNK